MLDGTISPEGWHFPVRNNTCRVSDIRKCELEGGIVSYNIIEPHWCFPSQGSDVYKNMLKINMWFNENKCWISRIDMAAY